MDSQSKDVMTVLELCAYLQMSEAKIREMLRQGTLPAVLIGRQWRIRKSAIDRWMAAQEGQRHVFKRRDDRLAGIFEAIEADRGSQTTLPPKPPGRQSQPVEAVDPDARNPLSGVAPVAGGEDAPTRRQLAQAAVRRDRAEKADAGELTRLNTTGSGDRARSGTGSRRRGQEN